MTREAFSSLFKVGDEVNSGGPPERANAARLRILSIEDQAFRYQSIGSKAAKRLKYSKLAVVVNSFDQIDPDSIQRTIQRVYRDAGLKEEVFTENYEYGFAREFLRRRERFAPRS